ncbi:MAG: M23 family metallopeptidase [Armatimonadetes bacterium]|nr:M23 family metallopeptidase [Armatimonadota bacterium]
MWILLAVLTALASLSGFSMEAASAGPRESGLDFSPTRASLETLRARGLEPTGLRPVYPAGVTCRRANSFFADRTRGDNSMRTPRFYHGFHGGLDIPAPDGTPILAIADGAVVSKKPGVEDGIGGIEIVLQHAPADTGFPVWLYSQYKHLKDMPALPVGERVRMGQQIALTGATGTYGHYGPQGSFHLHLTTFASPDDRFEARLFFHPPNGSWIDPLAAYRGLPLDTRAVRALPGDAKSVPIPHLIEGEGVVPEKSRLIWPYACRRS